MTLLIDKKEIVKKIHAQRKIERKLKSKKLTDIQCNTQIKMSNVLKLIGHKTVIQKNYVTYSKKIS